MAKEIELQNGMKAIVDDEDYERVNQYNWYVTGKTKPQVIRTIENNGNKTSVFLSHFILNHQLQEKTECILFKNGNNLDFQKDNLITANRQISARKAKSKRDSLSKYKGVSWENYTKKWRAKLTVNGQTISIGRFNSEDEAALAYNETVVRILGVQAHLNIIGEDNRADTLILPKVLNKRNPNISKTSTYRGVGVKKSTGKFESRIQKDGKQMCIGIFDTEIEAAKAYNEKAKELFGDKAILNDIPTNEYKLIEVIDIPDFRDFPKVENPEKWTTGPVTTKSGGAQIKQRRKAEF